MFQELHRRRVYSYHAPLVRGKGILMRNKGLRGYSRYSVSPTDTGCRHTFPMTVPTKALHESKLLALG